MADFDVDLPPVPVFQPMGQVVYRSQQCVQDMDMDKVKKHLRSFSKKQRYFTSVADVRASMNISALARNKKKLVGSNQFAAGARAQQDIQSRRASQSGARAQSAQLFVDHDRYVAAVERLKTQMNESADNEEFELAISFRNQMDELVKLREAFDASPSPSTLEALNKLIASA